MTIRFIEDIINTQDSKYAAQQIWEKYSFEMREAIAEAYNSAIDEPELFTQVMDRLMKTFKFL